MPHAETTVPEASPIRIAVNAELLAQIVEVSADAIFSEDLHGRISSWNAGAERLYGRSATDMIGQAAEDLLPAETAAQLRDVHRLAMSGTRVDRFDTWQQRPDGRHVAVSLTVSPLRGPGGEIAGLATSVQDVTDRVRLTAELEDAHRALEKEYTASSRSNRDLEQFAYVASHDLSEPLRVMTGFVQLLEQRYADVLDERGSRYIFHVVDGAARMRTLIDDLLEYSRFLRREWTGHLVDTAAVARRVIAGLGDPQVELGDLPAVWCDEGSLTAVLQNLIGNALKFHRPDTSARVRVSGWADGAHVQLCVDDDGIGIEPQYRERIFGMFSRLHVREAYPGTGIGLAIVQQIAERAEGRTWVESSPLGGSRFCITLPAPLITESVA
jgi:PAS domain S-box-containing protein